MPASCHRCGGDLPPVTEDTTFCPHCGSPQLYLQEYDRAVLAPDSELPSTSGAAPPPHPQQIDWQTAIRCGAFVSLIAAGLNLLAMRVPAPFVSLLNDLWIITASMITLTLYQRRKPLAFMDARIGARIGLTTGLLLIVAVISASAIAGVVARFGLHNMARFDADITQAFEAVKRSSASSATPPPQDLLRFFDLPEFHASMMLAGVGMVAFFLVLLSTFGGAVSGFLRSRKTITS
jgi:hypothetical protein